jgi:hypothetical protein
MDTNGRSQRIGEGSLMAANPGYCASCGAIGMTAEHFIARALDGATPPSVWLCAPCIAAVHHAFSAVVRAGMARAKARGEYQGRKRTLNPDQRAEAVRLHVHEGRSFGEIAAMFGCGRSIIFRCVTEAKAKAATI